jgi:hypothetical protein
MIFCGDFVFPSNFDSNIFSSLGDVFLNKPKIINFESTFLELNESKTTPGIPLFSSEESIAALKYLNVICTSHANNHVSDYKYNLKSYFQYFTDGGITPIGFGENINEASRPFVFDEEKLIVLSFGWEVIRCKLATVNEFGVNPYKYQWVEELVKEYQIKYFGYRIVLYIHWNYEFETYPSPADRQFSHHLIDIGVDAIFGHHPHIINGYEIYKNRPIFYSLGNFYFPQIKYGSHRLSFRDSALYGVSIDYNGNLNDLRIYHHRQDKKGEILRMEGCYLLDELKPLNEISGFQELSHRQYFQFYKENRYHKRKLLPIYKNYKHNFAINCYNTFVKYRQILIDVKTHIRL